MKTSSQAARLGLITALLLGPFICLAADSSSPPPPPPSGGASGPGARPMGPPPEAIAACKGKTVGATASFTGRNGETMSGTCQLAPGSGSVLAVRPDRMPGQGSGSQGGQPPQRP
jgi:hypothetical protein